VPPPTNPRDPWRKAPVGELQEQLLPRWFVILCLVMVPAAIAAVIAGFVVFSPAEVPVAARRPPPADGLTNDVGEYQIGSTTPEAYTETCPMLAGIHIAGESADLQALRTGLARLCNVTLPDDVADRLSRFASAGGVVRFAQFQQTGVDSTALLDAEPPLILLNARLQRGDPRWIAPAVAHDVTFLDVDPATAEGALTARGVEHLVCQRALGDARSSRGCEDAAALLALPDPVGALRGAGFR